jgi:hypothetical protein
MEFTHLVLTKFNVDTTYAPSGRGIDPKWLEDRLSLFLQYCYPSVTSNESVQFRWMVFCNALSPDWFKRKMGDLSRLVTPIYVRGAATDEVLRRKVMEANIVRTRYLITTRIDNDDAISRKHLSLVQQAFRNQEREFITFPVGLQLFRGHLYTVCYTCNPFLSLIERVSKNGEFTTVFCTPHPDVRTAGPVKRIWKASQWLQVLHSTNVGNSLCGWPRLRSRYSPEFTLSWPEEPCRDTFAQRIRYSAARPLGRISKLMAKAPGLGS